MIKASLVWFKLSKHPSGTRRKTQAECLSLSERERARERERERERNLSTLSSERLIYNQGMSVHAPAVLVMALLHKRRQLWCCELNWSSEAPHIYLQIACQCMPGIIRTRFLLLNGLPYPLKISAFLYIFNMVIRHYCTGKWKSVNECESQIKPATKATFWFNIKCIILVHFKWSSVVRNNVKKCSTFWSPV